MKLILTLTISVLLLSCGSTSSKSEQSKQDDEAWKMTDHTLTTNTYTTDGLLDTSYKTMLLYEMGMSIDTIKSIVVRKYDHCRLTNEKEFTLEKDGSKTLANEIIKQYDANEGLTIEINMMDSNMLFKTINKYNDKGQNIKSINFSQRVNNNPNDYILDSAVAHRNDKKQFQYDTTISIYEYDTNGNQIRTVISDTKGIIQKTSITQYLGNEKIFSFDINPQGDTTANFVFKHDGNLIKQIAEIKELNTVDTTWFYKDKIVKIKGRHGKMKYKSVITYNHKGDEIESFSYK